MNPECFDASDQQRFEFDVENDRFCCPKCGADRPPVVALLSLVHLQVRDKAGKMVGFGGLRYRVACDQKRVHVATISNDEAATGDIRFVNCPGCLKAAFEENLPKLNGFSLNK